MRCVAKASARRIVSIGALQLAVFLPAPSSFAVIQFSPITPGVNTFAARDGASTGWYSGTSGTPFDNLWTYDGSSLISFSRTEDTPDLLSIIRGLDPTHKYGVYFQYNAYNSPSSAAHYGSTARIDGGTYSQFSKPPGTTLNLETGYLGQVQGVNQAWMNFNGELASYPPGAFDRRSYVNAIGIEDLGLAPEVLSQPTGTIVHQKFFRGEREQFGYNPRFWPNLPGFNPVARPFIRVSKKNGTPVIDSYDANEGFVMTPGPTVGTWTNTRFDQAIKAKYPSWDGRFMGGVTADERVVFDDAGNAYMLVKVSNSAGVGGATNLLLHSRDNAQTWRVYDLPGTQWARFEMPDGHGYRAGPPVIAGFNGFTTSPITLFTPKVELDTTLSIQSKLAVPASAGALLSPLGTGEGNSTYTKGSKTHLVYLSSNPVPSNPNGTPQYIVTYDRATNSMLSPVLLGVNGHGGPDVHNGPAITADSNGYLHVILGGHHDNLMYTRSLQPNSSTGRWTAPIAIGELIDVGNEGGYTYPSVVMDNQNTLHVVARSAHDGYQFGLDYMRKTTNGAWENRGHIVLPFRQYYGTWFQKLTVDENDRLFLNYSYYGDQFSDDPLDPAGDEVAMYNLKWPDNPISLAPGSRPEHGTYLGVQPHDQVLLISTDLGNTWRLATSADFGTFPLIPEPAMMGMLSVIGFLTIGRRRMSIPLSHGIR